jgi:hypothetical protein
LSPIAIGPNCDCVSRTQSRSAIARVSCSGMGASIARATSPRAASTSAPSANNASTRETAQNAAAGPPGSP